MASLTPESSAALPFASARAVDDLHQFITRAKDFETDGARFQVLGDALAVTVSAMGPRGLGDQVPVVLGVRTFRLTTTAFDGLDAVFELSSITDRTARMQREHLTDFALPPVQLTVSWTAMAPPRTGWEQRALVDDFEIMVVAREGIEELATALPDNPGAAMVSKARAHVWAQDIGDPQIVQFPAGACLAAHTLGFLATGGETSVYAAGPWRRLNTKHGMILSRAAVAL